MAISDSYALIIGISQYQDERISKLNFTHSDAEEFHRLLLDEGRCGIPSGNVKLLLDDQATLFNIKHAISGWLYQQATDNSTVIIFYAGHGGVEPTRTGQEQDGISKYLLPWDANKDNLFASALSNSSFNQLLGTIRSQRMVIFMDACYSGGVAERGARDLGIVENPYERLAEGQGRLVISAAKPNQLSWEDESIGHGIFTHHLLEALSGKADTDNDGYVSAMEVFKYLEQNVPESARRLAKGDQHPLLCGDLAKDIILTVDKQRIDELRKKEEEEERKHREQLRTKRRRLFELYDEDHLSRKNYEQALRLIEKKDEELTKKELHKKKLAEAVINDGISVETYLASLEAMEGGEKPELTPEPIKPEARNDGNDSKKEPKLKFCIHCGTKVIENKKFCIGCGKQYSHL